MPNYTEPSIVVLRRKHVIALLVTEYYNHTGVALSVCHQMPAVTACT